MNQHQVRARAAQGECAGLGAGSPWLAANADQSQPDLGTGAGFTSTPAFALQGHTGGASRSVLFIRNARSGHLPGFAHWCREGTRRVGRCTSRPLRLAVNSQRQSLCGALRLPEHVRRQTADAAEGHNQRPFMESRSNDRNRDTPERPKSWKRQPRIAK